MNRHVALSFSGGKDSCFSLYRLQQQNIQVSCLITTVWKERQETVAHGEKLERIKEQAESLDLPVYFIETGFESYTEDFVLKLKDIKDWHDLDGVAFGDIYLAGHREWGEQVAEEAGLEALYPLWTEKGNALSLLQQFVASGFEAQVIRVDNKKLSESWIGRKVDESFIAAIAKEDVCPLGESGEYHTVVYDGPCFHHPIKR